jgi:hypothetical protein
MEAKGGLYIFSCQQDFSGELADLSCLNLYLAHSNGVHPKLGSETQALRCFFRKEIRHIIACVHAGGCAKTVISWPK